MSKCYVIKNNKGKYFGYYDTEHNKMEFSNKPQRFIMFNTFRNAKKIKNFWGMEDCEVVECTICEGDLEKELEELKQQLEATERMRQEVIDEGLKCEQQHIKNQNIIAIEELNKVLKQLTTATITYLIQRIKELEEKDET